MWFRQKPGLKSGPGRHSFAVAFQKCRVRTPLIGFLGDIKWVIGSSGASNCHFGTGISSIQRSPSVESSELVALQPHGVSCTKSKFPFHEFLYLTRLLFPPQHEPELQKVCWYCAIGSVLQRWPEPRLWKLGEDAVVLSRSPKRGCDTPKMTGSAVISRWRPPWQAAIPSYKAKATAVRQEHALLYCFVSCNWCTAFFSKLPGLFAVLVNVANFWSWLRLELGTNARKLLWKY